MHYYTGRHGTVTAVHADGLHIDIKFDLFNPYGWKYNNDGWNETRKKSVFVVKVKAKRIEVDLKRCRYV